MDFGEQAAKSAIDPAWTKTATACVQESLLQPLPPELGQSVVHFGGRRVGRQVDVSLGQSLLLFLFKRGRQRKGPKCWEGFYFEMAPVAVASAASFTGSGWVVTWVLLSWLFLDHLPANRANSNKEANQFTTQAKKTMWGLLGPLLDGKGNQTEIMLLDGSPIWRNTHVSYRQMVETGSC